MTGIQACILGIIQGIAEFLPVSSSGHLELAQYLLGLENLDRYLAFDLVCHLGTLCAIFAVYLENVKRLFAGNWMRLKQIALGTAPLIPVLFILKPLESLYNQPQLLGLFFLITAALLYSGVRWGYEKPAEKRQKSWLRDAFLIGVFQSLALLPGVSRSGSTISAARIFGWEKQEALTFSFLLAIPAILGGSIFKFLELAFVETALSPSLPLSLYVLGFVSSFVVGILSLVLLIRLASKGKFMYFVWYCFLLGLGLSLYFYV